MAKAVVAATLLRVRQNAVSLCSFLKFFFGLWIGLVFVRMILVREPPVGALQLLLSRGATHTQNFVIIAFVIRHKASTETSGQQLCRLTGKPLTAGAILSEPRWLLNLPF